MNPVNEEKGRLGRAENNFTALLKAVPASMLIADAHARIKIVNPAAMRLFKKRSQELVNSGFGRLLGCVHQKEAPEGCGFSNSCPSCPIFRALQSVVKHGQSVRKAETLTMLTRDGKPVAAWIHPDDRDLVRKKIDSGNEKPYLVTALRKDGTTFPAEIQARMIAYDGRRVRVTALRDISEIKVLEHRLQSILDNSTAVIYLKDVYGKYILVNRQYEKLFDISKDEIVGKSDHDLFPGPAAGKVRDHDKEVLRQNAPVEFEEVIPHADGNHTYISIKFPISDLSGTPYGVCGISTDITERRLAERELTRHRDQLESLVKEQTAALAESRERFKGIFNNMTNGVVVYEAVDQGRDFIIKEINPASERIEDISGQDAVGRRVTEVFPGIESFGLLEVFRRVWRTGKPENHPVGFYRDNRIQGWRENHVTKLPMGEIVAIYDDMTEKKRAEEKLQLSEERFSLFMKHLPGVAFIKDHAGRYAYVNHSMNELTRKKEGEIIGMTDHALFPRKLAQTMVENDNRVRSKRAPITVEESVVFDGGEVSYIWVKFPYPMPDGQLGVAGVGIDITEIYKMRREKRLLEAQLKHAQKMEAIGTLAGGIAHDFNNILSAIMGYTELAISDLGHGSTKRRQLGQVLKAGGRARDLIKQILAFGRQSDHTLKPLKVQMVIEEAITLLRPSIPSTIDIQMDIDPGCGEVLADPTQIHQVIVNLCTNAYQAMRKTGGVLRISLQQLELFPEDISKEIDLQPGKYAKLVVSDSGSGIEKDLLEKFFEPYFSTKNKKEGTGLGLAVVHGIVTSLGGTIKVESDLGSGTRFEILLPLSTKTGGQAVPVKLTPVPTGREHLLLVDDDGLLVQMTKDIIESLGYRVTAVSDSVEAFERFQDSPETFDLLVTDMIMPNMTGAVLAEKVLDVKPSMPVIILTGFSDQMNADQARAMGIDGYLTKPVLRRDLAIEIRRVLDGQSGV